MRDQIIPKTRKAEKDLEVPSIHYFSKDQLCSEPVACACINLLV
jgi:hypothetical protein